MKLFGITGGIGMGKSTAGKLLKQRGIPVVDTDTIARQVVQPGQPALVEITDRFGTGVLRPDGTLDRAQLARRVFAEAGDRADLEAMLHPRIRAAWMAEAEAWRQAGRGCGVVVIPLLFETQAEMLFDATICLACSAESQSRRLRARGWDEAQCRQRLEAQWPTEKKIARSDYVIWTDTTLEAHAAQLEKIIP
jgi:dephospho-CoA kinase